MRCSSNSEVHCSSLRFMAVCSTMKLWCAMVAIFESCSMTAFKVTGQDPHLLAVLSVN